MTLDTDDYFTKLYVHFLRKRHMANNDFVSELVKVLTEFGGRVFIQRKKIFDQKTIDANKKLTANLNKIKGELEDNIIHRLLEVDNKSNEVDIDVVIHKTCKDQTDHDLVTARRIKSTFGLKKLNYTFLKDLGHHSNIDAFYKSLIYFSSDHYKRRYLSRYKDEFEPLMAPFDRARLIEKIIALYWSAITTPDGSQSRAHSMPRSPKKSREANELDEHENLNDPIGGLLDTRIIKVYSGKTSALTDKQKRYIAKYEKDIRFNFKFLRRRTSPKNSYQLLCWADTMLKEFFGGFIRLNISTQKETRIKEKRVRYYNVNIDQLRYLELLLNKNIKIVSGDALDNINLSFGNINCHYGELHSCSKIKDLCKVTVVDNIYNRSYVFDSDSDSDS